MAGPGSFVVIPLLRVATTRSPIILLSGVSINNKGEKVSKRDKKIEVNVKDIERHHQPVQQIFIGRRLIGEVTTENERFKALLVADQSEFNVRSQEEGLEMVLQQYHLHQR